MHNLLRAYLANLDFTIEGALWEKMKVNSKIMQLKKGEVLIQHGSINKNAYFVASGILATSMITEDGNRKAIWFNFDSDFQIALCPDSFFLDQPTQYEVSALEDSVVIRTHKQHIEAMTEQSSKFNKISFKDVTTVSTAIQELRSYRLSHTPLQFLNYLNKKHPVFAQRLPSKQMAHFLGISPEWYSKLKKRKTDD